MGVTIFGVVVLAIGLFMLVRGSMTGMLAFVMLTTLMGGSAAISLPALGGSSIPPANLALLFLLLRALLPGPGQMASLTPAIRDNAFLIIFVLYGSITALILPRVFVGATKVTPLHPGAVRLIFEAAPVHFTSQNITTAFYLSGTLIAGLGAYIGAAKPGGAAVILRTAIAIAIIHALLGFLSVTVAGTPLNSIIEFFRNGHYAQLDQSLDGVNRMNGIWPEASGFAAYGGAWFIFMTELWLRDVRPRATGLAAALLGSALLISTSSTAYVALAGYSVIVMARTLVVPWGTPGHKLLALGAMFFAISVAIVAALTLSPAFFTKISHILAVVTVNKTDSYSGIQRLFWAKQGFDAFLVSGGLGIGAGSFRSSSLLTAILGSMGVIGTVAFVGHLMRAFMPLRASTYSGVTGGVQAMGSAASWASVLMLMPAAVASPSPDPGAVWAMFTGLAIGLRAHRTVSVHSPAGHKATTTADAHPPMPSHRALS